MVTKQNQDLTLVIDNKAEKVTAQALEPAPAPAEASEDEAEASSPPPAAAPSESSGASEEDCLRHRGLNGFGRLEEEDLPQILIPEVLETAPKKPTERESPSRSRMASESQAKPSFGATPESPSKASRPKTVKLPVEPLPVASKAEGLVTPNWSGLEVRSPEAKPIRKEEVAGSIGRSPTLSAVPRATGDPRFMSPSASEQQKQIQSGLKEALNYHRRLWADELHRCRLASAELEKALEDERRQHAEQIEEWERRLQSELAKKETQWREEAQSAESADRQITIPGNARHASPFTRGSPFSEPVIVGPDPLGVMPPKIPAWAAARTSPKAKAKAKAKARAEKPAPAPKRKASGSSDAGKLRKSSSGDVGKAKAARKKGGGKKQVDDQVPGAGGYKVYQDYSVKLNQTNVILGCVPSTVENQKRIPDRIAAEVFHFPMLISCSSVDHLLLALLAFGQVMPDEGKQQQVLHHPSPRRRRFLSRLEPLGARGRVRRHEVHLVWQS
eukprot:g15296.t1